MTKRKHRPNPLLLRTAIITTPYAHHCELCRREVGHTSHPAREDAPQLICSACKRAMRQGRAA